LFARRAFEFASFVEVFMCPYCQFEEPPQDRCPMCDEYEADLRDLLEMALPLQKEMEKESAQITDMMIDHNMLLMDNKRRGFRRISTPSLLREDRELLRQASEIRVRYSMQLGDASMHYPTLSGQPDRHSQEC